MAAAYIKNQIVKHLSKFAKNVTPDQVSVEVLRGKAELHNIEVNEKVLADVLELPAWMHIDSALCTRVAVNVPWTRLKSAPMQLLIDEIRVFISLSAGYFSEQQPTVPAKKEKERFAAASSFATDQGFVQRIIENMSLYVNTVEVHFKSELFSGDLMLSRLAVESRTPQWSYPDDVRKCRLKQPSTGDAIMFKQISWNLLRVEAMLDTSTSSVETANCGPLRLITSDGKCRLAVKKSGADNQVCAGRIQLIMDDILWVATLVQVRTAIRFYRHLMDLINATSSKSEKAGKALSNINKQGRAYASSHMISPRTMKKNASTSTVRAEELFNHVDMRETSLHVYVAKVDLHFTDDSASDKETLLPPAWDIVGGAVQVTLLKLGVDIYPYHVAGSSRNHWVRYRHQYQCKKWLEQLLAHYNIVSEQQDANMSDILLSQVLVVRIDDLVVFAVNDEGTARCESQTRILCADKQCNMAPMEQPLIHAEFTEFYRATAKEDIFTPPPANHILVSPMHAKLHTRTLRWLHYIYQDVFKQLDLDMSQTSGLLHQDIRVELTMPKLVIHRPLSVDEGDSDPLVPTTLELRLSTALISNCAHIGEVPLSPSTDLERVSATSLLQRARSMHLVDDNDATLWQKAIDELFDKHNTKRQAAGDLWTIHAMPLWADFTGARAYYAQSTAPLLFDCAASLFATIDMSIRIKVVADLFDFITSEMRISVHTLICGTLGVTFVLFAQEFSRHVR